jgi:hypothetical protein
LALLNYQTAASRLMRLTGLAANPDTNVSTAEYSAAALEARKASFDYWNAAQEELDRLLAARIAHFREVRTRQLSCTALALLAASILALWLLRRIMRPLKFLVDALGAGATLIGECATRISVVGHSPVMDRQEAFLLCGELGAYSEGMSNAILELARHVTGGGAEERIARATNELVDVER